MSRRFVRLLAASGVVVAGSGAARPSAAAWLTDPRAAVLLVLGLIVVVGIGRNVLHGLQSRRALARLDAEDVTPIEVASAASFGRAAMSDLVRLRETGRDAQHGIRPEPGPLFVDQDHRVGRQAHARLREKPFARGGLSCRESEHVGAIVPVDEPDRPLAEQAIAVEDHDRGRHESARALSVGLGQPMRIGPAAPSRNDSPG